MTVFLSTMKPNIRNFILCILCVALFVPFSNTIVLADTGPKPSVELDIRGLEGETYYVTLLSNVSTIGPWDATRGYESELTDNYDVWNAMHNYKDKDGFYFLGRADNCSHTHTFSWTYYPPDTFKVLIYLPESNRFIVSSKSYDCYTFYSFFTATIQKDDITLTKATTVAPEGLHILARILLTLVIELGIAFFFGYRKKLNYLIFTITNIVTQLLLNIFLLSALQSNGKGNFYYLLLLLAEITILILEGLVYYLLLGRHKENPNFVPDPWFYSFIANGASFLVGIIFTAMLPSIF